MDQKFSIQPCVPADAHGIAVTMMSSWWENWHWRYRWADPDLETLINWCEAKLPWNLSNNRSVKRHQKVIVTETGEIVGYARWLLPLTLAEKTGEEVVWKVAQAPEPSMEEARKWEDQWVVEMPKLRSDEMLAYRAEGCEAAEQRITKGDQVPFLVLDWMTVHPAWQHQGVATMLMKSGLDIADQYQQKAYAIGTSEGAKLYESVGFSTVEVISTDYSQFGGIGPYVNYFMLRDPVLKEC